MAELILERAVHRRYPRPVAAQEAPLSATRDWLCDELAQMAAMVTEGVAAADIATHVLCSTTIDRPLSSGLYHWETMRARMLDHGGIAPETVVNAYECASWGYALRHFLRQEQRARHAVIHIADVNVLGLSMWEANENWGESGFGITSLLFRAEDDAALTTGHSKTGQRVAEFVIDVRKAAQQAPAVPVALPFFPENVTGVLNRSLAGMPRLADLHPHYGHCFGSDPWLAIIDDMARHDAPAARRYLATSIALVGYWAIAPLRTCEHGVYRIEEKLT